VNAPKPKHPSEMTESERRLAARENLAETRAMMDRIIPAHLREKSPESDDVELSAAGRCFKKVRSILGR